MVIVAQFTVIITSGAHIAGRLLACAILSVSLSWTICLLFLQSQLWSHDDPQCQVANSFQLTYHTLKHNRARLFKVTSDHVLRRKVERDLHQAYPDPTPIVRVQRYSQTHSTRTPTHIHTQTHTHTHTHTHKAGMWTNRNANHSPIEAQSPIQAIPMWSHEAEVPSWSELISGFRQNTRRSDVVTWFAQNPPAPGVEPGPPGWKPGILTARPRGTIRMQHIPPLNMSINKSTHTFPLSYHSPDA